jgi:thiamine kinase-like enzyme
MSNLVGHSGCNLDLISYGDKLVIRKSSKSIDYNKRLELQYLKQKIFKNDQIKAPKVFDSGIEKGLFYFDMEYINGIRFNDYIKSQNYDKVFRIFSTLTNFVISNFTDEHINKSSEILLKIESTNSANLIDINVFNKIITYSSIPIRLGYCHGDLTFENIIISNDEIYLIDFLDSFIDSPIIDISKLLQEFELNWSNRNDSPLKFLPIIRNIFLKNHLLNSINCLNLNNDTIYLQKKLTLMRILPYTNNFTLKLSLIELINK